LTEMEFVPIAIGFGVAGGAIQAGRLRGTVVPSLRRVGFGLAVWVALALVLAWAFGVFHVWFLSCAGAWIIVVIGTAAWRSIRGRRMRERPSSIASE
jgi:hypothetical protein